ncbi:MAG: hemerythrin domain-containing protein [Actinomycetota bacterium]|nr:hemerythrin domain-containing protein [Actinomycetota bacterium]
MDALNQATTPELSHVRERRRRLRNVALQLEEALALAAGRQSEWRDTVATALAQLQDTLDDHIAGTEGSGGLFAQIRDDEPRLESRVAKLHEEHESLKGEVAELLARLRGDVPDVNDVAEIREAALLLLGLVVRHRQRGSDLLYEAYSVDVSAGD